MPNSSAPSRVLHISTWGMPCGIATYCANLVAALERQGVESDVFALQPHAWSTYLPCDTHRLQSEIVMRAREVDVVHIQHEHGLFGIANGARSAARNYGRILSGLLATGKPVVTTFHTAPITGKKHRGIAALLDPIKAFNRGRTWRNRVGKPFAAAPSKAVALVHAATTRRAFVRSGLPESSVRLIPHGCLPQRTHTLDSADAKRALGYSSADKLLTIFGFIGPYKGHDIAVDALTYLPSEYRLAICGGAHPESKDRFFERLVGKIEKLGLRDRVTITGWLPTDQAEVYYAATDVCLAPYRDESGLSASGAVTWALSSGRPTVASKIDAFQAIQRESPCMLMTTPQQPKELAWAVSRLVADKPMATRLVEAASTYCDRHSWDSVARLSVDLYQELLTANVTTKTPVWKRIVANLRKPRWPAPAIEVSRPKSLADSIRETQTLDGWCPLEKAEALARLVLDVKPACIAEIGVYGGRSLIPMALAAKTYGGTVHGIDPWSHEAALEGDVGADNSEWWGRLDIEKIYQGFLGGIRRFGVEDTLRVHRTTDVAALGEFQDGQIGILHVDGNHSSEVSRRYVEQWGPKITAGGYLVMDDIDWQTQAETLALIEQTYLTIRKEKSWAIYRKPLAVPAVVPHRAAA